MRIGTQNVLLIVPLFIILAAVLGGLFYVGEQRQRIWGQEEQASAYAISISEFVRQNATDSAGMESYSPAKNESLRKALDRILSDGRVNAIFALTPGSRSVIWSYPAGAVATAPTDTPRDLTTIMTRDGIWTSDVIKTGRRTAIVQAYSSVMSPDNKLLGSIGVISNASSYLSESLETRNRVAVATIVVIVIGLLITVLISGLVSREVRNLSRTAALISGGNLDVQARAGRIQEIGDLGNTFNTMSEVLKDVLSRTKRSLIEGEQFRTHAELASSYVDMFRPALAEDIHGLRVTGRTLGNDFGLFWTAFETSDGCCVALGRLTAEDDVSTAITASAATRYLRHRLSNDGPRQTLHEVVELFRPDFLECLYFTNGTVEHWKAAPAASTADVDPAESALQNVLPSGQPAVQSYADNAQSLWVLHTFTPDATGVVDQYMRVFGRLAPDDLVHDIIAALPNGTEGAVIVVGAQAHASAVRTPADESAHSTAARK